jgi:tetratricopeptide (TPR) repeat protein
MNLDLKETNAQAARAFARSDHEGALRILDAGLAKAGAHPPFLRLKTRILLSRGEVAEALALVRDMPERLRTGKLADAAMRVLLAAGETRQATALMDAVPAESRSDQSCQLAAIWLAENRDGGAAALARARDCHLAHPKRTLILKEYVRLARLHGDRAALPDVLRAAIARDPQASYVRELARLFCDAADGVAALDLLDGHRGMAADHSWWHLARLDALACLGRTADLLPAAETAVATFPRDARINERHWQILARADRRAEGVAACKDFAARIAEDPQARLKCAQFLIEAGETDASDALIEALDSAGDETALSLTLQARLRFLQHDALAAMALALQARDLPGASLDTVRTLARAERALGDHAAAIATLESLLEAGPVDPGACLDAAESCGAIGAFDRAEAFLARVPASNIAVQPRLHALRARFLLAQNRFDAALSACEASTKANPDYPAPLVLKAICALLTGQVAEAWTAQSAHARLRADEDLSGQVSGKARSSVLGHLVNEYRLLGPDPDLAHCTVDADQAAAARVFRTRLAEDPGSTVFALCLLSAICRTGGIGAAPPEVSARRATVIPRRIYQFWDAPDLPEQVAWTMERNRRLNPGHDHVRLSEADAIAYLEKTGEHRALRGFRLSTAPAQKADILRLALLYHEGGIYMDADDRCLEPLDDWLDHRLDFVGYQEMYRSIGNNFMAARPGLAMFRDALNAASEASLGPLGETLWLSAGPGVVTRAFADRMTDTDGGLVPSVWIMPDHRLRQSVAPHNRLSYKGTANHWVRQFLRADAGR